MWKSEKISNHGFNGRRGGLATMVGDYLNTIKTNFYIFYYLQAFIELQV